MKGRFRGRGFRRNREPTAWFRNALATGAVVGSAVSTLAASPFQGSVDSGASPIDRRLTLLRFKVALVISNDVGFTPAAGDAYELYWGVYFKDVGAPTPDPSLATAADQTADWLHLELIPINNVIAAGPTQGVQANTTPWQYHHCDVKAKRKCDSTEAVNLAFRVRSLAGGAVNGTYRINALCSALYQRTRR